MRIDLTYQLSREKISELSATADSRDKSLISFGHMGTHFDTMGKTFSLDYCECPGVIFDVSKFGERDIELADIDAEKISAGDFVLFHTATIDRYEYWSKDYSTHYPQLSWELIELLVAKKVHIIGIDARGLRKGSEHPKADEFCAGNGVFIVENLVNLGKLFDAVNGKNFTVHTYPLNLVGFSGIPCRVVAEIG